MFVLSNRRLGAASEVLVSREVAGQMLRATAAEVARAASSRWERELAAWLEARAEMPAPAAPGTQRDAAKLDVEELAWSPDHFDRQRRFLLEAIERVRATAAHTSSGALARWARLIEAHPKAFVQVGRRWRWHASI